MACRLCCLNCQASEMNDLSRHRSYECITRSRSGRRRKRQMVSLTPPFREMDIHHLVPTLETSRNCQIPIAKFPQSQPSPISPIVYESTQKKNEKKTTGKRGLWLGHFSQTLTRREKLMLCRRSFPLQVASRGS